MLGVVVARGSYWLARGKLLKIVIPEIDFKQHTPNELTS